MSSMELEHILESPGSRMVLNHDAMLPIDSDSLLGGTTNGTPATPTPRQKQPGISNSVRTNGRWFQDCETERIRIFRGINVSGSSKLPSVPDLPSHHPDASLFFDSHKTVSFVGKPFPLDEAGVHFHRLRAWGYNLIRFCITWEAVEHEGPGIYDQAFLSYLVQVLKIAGIYGFKVLIDAHQDVWSRFSGGSGAPGWTFNIAGIDFRKFKETEAAIVHNTYEDQENYPRMIWSTNAFKFASMTMYTLFFGGRTFAPKLTIDGVNIQDILQGAYIAMMETVANAIVAAELDGSVVIGYDTMNEPSHGFIGLETLNELQPQQTDFHYGVTPTPFEGIQLAAGDALRVNEWDLEMGSVFGNVLLGTKLCNPERVSVWADRASGCVWAQHGVWDPTDGTLLRPEYFKNVNGRYIDFMLDFWKPFVGSFESSIRAIQPDAIIFVNGEAFGNMPEWELGIDNLAFSSHWYDGLTLLTKKFSLWTVDIMGLLRDHYFFKAAAVSIGKNAIKTNFAGQLSLLENDIEGYPLLVGEIGIPFDMNKKRAYLEDSTVEDPDARYRMQINAADASAAALEINLLSFTWWNYTPDNCHSWGDLWNGEDLSIYSKNDDPGDGGVFSGGRALRAIVRPFPAYTCGTPLSFEFNCYRSQMEYSFEDSGFTKSNLATIIFLPLNHFSSPQALSVELSDGSFDVFELEDYLELHYYYEKSQEVHSIRISSLDVPPESCCSRLCLIQ